MAYGATLAGTIVPKLRRNGKNLSYCPLVPVVPGTWSEEPMFGLPGLFVPMLFDIPGASVLPVPLPTCESAAGEDAGGVVLGLDSEVFTDFL